MSAVVVPGASPASISACLTQVRKASGWISSWSAIRLIAPVFVAGFWRASSAIRVARSLSSSLYFRGAAMTLILHWIESLHQTRGASDSEARATVGELLGTLSTMPPDETEIARALVRMVPSASLSTRSRWRSARSITRNSAMAS